MYQKRASTVFNPARSIYNRLISLPIGQRRFTTSAMSSSSRSWTGSAISPAQAKSICERPCARLSWAGGCKGMVAWRLKQVAVRRVGRQAVRCRRAEGEGGGDRVHPVVSLFSYIFHLEHVSTNFHPSSFAWLAGDRTVAERGPSFPCRPRARRSWGSGGWE